MDSLTCCRCPKTQFQQPWNFRVYQNEPATPEGGLPSYTSPSGVWTSIFMAWEAFPETHSTIKTTQYKCVGLRVCLCLLEYLAAPAECLARRLHLAHIDLRHCWPVYHTLVNISLHWGLSIIWIFRRSYVTTVEYLFGYMTPLLEIWYIVWIYMASDSSSLYMNS